MTAPQKRAECCLWCALPSLWCALPQAALQPGPIAVLQRYGIIDFLFLNAGRAVGQEIFTLQNHSDFYACRMLDQLQAS